MADNTFSPGNSFDLNLADDIPNFWRYDGDRYFGEFSMAMMGSAEIFQDDIQVVVSKDGSVFAGVYEGHNGHRASTYVSENMYYQFRRFVDHTGMISGYSLLNAFIQTENGFLDRAQKEFRTNPQFATSGSCCLVGVLSNRGILHLGNLGNCRAVLGYEGRFGEINALQLTVDHNINDTSLRQDYLALHPGNNVLLKEEDGLFTINGTHEISGSIGDATLKWDSLAIKTGDFQVDDKFHRPLLDAVPSIQARQLVNTDKFVIFATKGLWDLLTNKEAVELVNENPNVGAACKLIEAALRKIAARSRISYEALVSLSSDEKSEYHDDISVTVLFVDDSLLKNPRDMATYAVVGGWGKKASPDLYDEEDFEMDYA